MIEEAIVHIGMHKTGSSSIQQTLNMIPMEEVEYLSLGPENHSAFLATLLSNNPENYHVHARSGRTLAHVQALKEKYTQKLHAALKATNKTRVLISAEYLSQPNGGGSELEYLKSIILQYCRRVRIIGYVRSPIGYMQSAFQQRLKGGGVLDFNLQAVYPDYFRRLSKLDDIFGKKNVELIHYSYDVLYKGDAVQDFARRIGANLDPDKIVRTNESLSLEATALLYTFRRFGGGSVGYEGFNHDNNLLVSALSGLGDQKLVFSRSLVASVLETNSEDIDWISRRLGCSIIDQPAISSNTIRSEKDLLQVAYENRSVIWELLNQTQSLPHDVTGVARLVDRLYTLNADNIPSYKSPENTFFSQEQMNSIVSANGNGSELLMLLADALAKVGKTITVPSLRRASKRISDSLNDPYHSIASNRDKQWPSSNGGD